MKQNCNTCSAKITEDYCTRQLDMKKAKYIKCNGWHQAPVNQRKIIDEGELQNTKSLREQRLMAKIEFNNDFLEFIEKGGHYSFNLEKQLEEKNGKMPTL